MKVGSNWYKVFAPVIAEEWVELVVTTNKITNEIKLYLGGDLVDTNTFPGGDWLTAGETPFYLMGQATNFDKCIEGSLVMSGYQVIFIIT